MKNILQIKTNYFKFLLFISFSLIQSVLLFAQTKGNNIVVTSSNITFPNLTTYTQIETEQSILNAIGVTVKSGGAYHMYVRVSNMTTTSTTPPVVSLMKIQLASSTVGSTTTPTTGKLTLSATDQQLSVCTFKTSNTGDVYSYNIFFGPLGYNYAPGTYNFTLLFSMTQP